MRSIKIKKTEKLKTFAVVVYGHVYIISIILRGQNKIIDFFIITAWASPFNLVCPEFLGAI